MHGWQVWNMTDREQFRDMKDSVIGGDVVSKTTTTIINDPKAIMEAYFSLQKYEETKVSKQLKTNESTKIELNSPIFQTAVHLAKKTQLHDFGLYLDSSNFYIRGVDPYHVMLIEISSDDSGFMPAEVETIHMDTSLYSRLFPIESTGKVLLKLHEGVFHVSQNQTVLELKTEKFNDFQIPDIQFQNPPLPLIGKEIVNIVTKIGAERDLDFTFNLNITFNLDPNGDLWLNMSKAGDTIDPGNWHHLKRYLNTDEFIELPIQSRYSWNYIGPIVEENYNRMIHINFGNDCPLSFYFNIHGCHCIGYIAPVIL